MFNNFLVSSQVHFEKNALSEAAWILSEYVPIESFKVKLLPVGGLGLLSVEQAFDLPITITEYVETLLKTKNVYYCFKIIPFEHFGLNSEEFIYTWVEDNKKRILPSETWRIIINKRHSSIDTKNMITNIAKKISNSVDLKNPQKIIQIEIIGKYVGLSILESYQVMQLSTKITKVPLDPLEPEEDDEIAV